MAINGPPLVAYTAAIAERFQAGSKYKQETQENGLIAKTPLSTHQFATVTPEKRYSLWDLCTENNTMYLVIANDYYSFESEDGEKKPPTYPVATMEGLKNLVNKHGSDCCYLTPFPNKEKTHEYAAQIELLEPSKHFFVEGRNHEFSSIDQHLKNPLAITAFRCGDNIYLPPFVFYNANTLDALFKFRTQFAVPKALRDHVFSDNVVFTPDKWQDILHIMYPPSQLKIKAGTSFYHTGSAMSAFPQVSHTSLSGRTLNMDEKEKEKMNLFFQWHPVFISSNLTTVAPCRPSSLDGTAVAEYVTEDIEISDKQAYHIVCFNNNPLNQQFVSEIHELIEKVNQSNKQSENLILLIWHELPRIDTQTNLPVFSVIDNESKVSMITFHHTLNPQIAKIHKQLFMCAEGKKAPPFRIVKNIASLTEHSVLKIDE